MMLEARHAWRAVCDHLTHEFRPAVERLARQHRSELAQDEVRLGMADAAALLVKPPSEPLLLGQLMRIAALREYGWRGNGAKQESCGGAHHPWHSPKFIVLASIGLRWPKRKGAARSPALYRWCSYRSPTRWLRLRGQPRAPRWQRDWIYPV